jgi:hypothetical protein
VKIIFDLDQDQVVSLLCVAASQDADFTYMMDRNLSKSEIRQLCTEVLRSHGFQHDGWGDDLSDYQQAEINGWANAQVRRYKI